MQLENLTSENLIKLEENLSEFKGHHQKKGAENVHRLIKAKLYDDKSGRCANEDFWNGYDAAILAAMALIRDELIFKPNKG
jgi:hypothetical protein